MKFQNAQVLDTNIILDDFTNVKIISEEGKNLIIVPHIVLEELDSKKVGFNEINFQSREFARLLSDMEIVKSVEDEKLIISFIRKDELNIALVRMKKFSDSSITNDYKIIETCKACTKSKLLEDIKTFKFVSNDILCRTLAISENLNTTKLQNNTLETLDTEYVKTITISSSLFNGLQDKFIEDYDKDYKPENYCYCIKSVDGNSRIAYIIDGKIRLIKDDLFNGLAVKPLNIGQRFAVAGMLDTDIDVCIINALAGCCLEGTTIEIESKPEYISTESILKLLNITTKQLKFIRNKKWVLSKKNGRELAMYDKNSINYAKIKIIDSKNIKQACTALAIDKNFTSKYLKLEYWLGFNDIDFSLQKIKILRKYKIYFENLNLEDHPNFKPSNFQKTIMNIQSLMINTNFKNKTEIGFGKNTCVLKYWTIRGWNNEESKAKQKESLFGNQWPNTEFWLRRGYTKIEAKKNISKKQSDRSKLISDKYTSDEIQQLKGYPNSIEYWLDKGFSIEESKLKLKEKQSTFSLDKCIKKYGEVKGTEIWHQRQTKWQNTLKSKPQDEIDDINRRKSSGIGKYLDRTLPGKLYYIHFYNEEIEFWKIGITSRSINDRFNLSVFKEKYNLNYNIEFINDLETIQDAYYQEQYILNKFNSNRITINYNGFCTTECFDSNILKALP